MITYKNLMEENILIFINDRSEEENVRDDRVDNFS